MRVSLLADPAETDYQRLQAQNVQSKKAHKVLVDVLRALFAEIFIEEVFRPQETYSAASTRQIFATAVRSSASRARWSFNA